MRKKTTNKNIEESVYNFLKNIEIKNKTILLAFSSGIDSSVLLDILLKLKNRINFNIAIAHVNYNLRGEQSILDKCLAIKLAKKNNINIYIEEIESGKYKNKNLQKEAREDRYNFFNKLYKEKLFDYLITAHHKDDLVETIIYKIVKGAGSNVYKSMNKKSSYILRPLINVYRSSIEEYAKKYSIEYREDLSNKENKYSRNKIRNMIIPLLEDINKSSKDNIINFSKTVYKETKYLRARVKKSYKETVINNVLQIDKYNKLPQVIKNRILKKIMFKNSLEITSNRIEEIKKIISSSKNKIEAKFENKYIVKNYNTLTIKTSTIKEIEKKEKKEILNISNDGVYSFCNKKLKVKIVKIDNNTNFKDNSKVYLNIDYPFIIRSKNNGETITDKYLDKKLKLKKLFIDTKINIKDRESIPVVEKDNEIVAVCFGLIYNSKNNRISKKAFVDNNKKAIVITSI